MADPRQQGSTWTARILGVVLVGWGVAMGVLSVRGHEPNLMCHRSLVDNGASMLFGAILLWWGFSKSLKNTGQEEAGKTKPKDHHPHSTWRIGFETITMVVGVLTALIAIWTLTDTASQHCKNATVQTVNAVSKKD